MPIPQSSTAQTPAGKGLNANFLKLFAALTMLIDHAAITLVYARLKLLPDFAASWALAHAADATDEQLASISGEFLSLFTVLQTMRLIGRIAFPIFCFLVFEGFNHTKNLRKYLLRLFICAVFAELPFNLLCSNYNEAEATLLYPQVQNTVWTLLIALLLLCGLKRLEAKDISVRASLLQMAGQFSLTLAACLAAVLLRTDYSYLGPLLAAIFYFCRRNKRLQILLGCILFLPVNIAHLFAFLPIAFYNGELLPSKRFRLFFYWFYPVHLLVLYLLTLLL